MKQLNNESGITLIEVLATLTITAIIGSVVYAVFFQTLHAKEKAQSHNELRQEANIVITQLRTMHENSEDLYSNADMLYRSPDNPLVLNQDGTKQFSFLKVEINGTNKLTPGNATPVKSVEFSSSSTDTVYLQMADQHGNKYELKTVLVGSQLVVDKPGSFPTKPLGCKPPGYTFPNIIYGTTCVDGLGYIDSDQHIQINGMLYVAGDLVLATKGNRAGDTLTINNGDFIVTETLTINNQNEITVNNGEAFLNNVVFTPQSSLTVNGNTNILGTITGINENNTQICIEGTLSTKQDLSSTIHVDPSLSCPNNRDGIYAKAYQKLN